MQKKTNKKKVLFRCGHKTTAPFEGVRRIPEHSEVPDGDDVREKDDESEKVAEPRTHKPLQRYHDDRQNHLGQEQSLSEAVQLQVQQADLWGTRCQRS